MAAPDRETIGDESLENWKELGSGGFGCVYKASHKDWGFDVAIKLLHVGSDTLSTALGREARHMDAVAHQFVPKVYGMYQGIPPVPDLGYIKRQGIVMELMERGSLLTLQKALSGPAPWPLAFRLANQVAVAMNFLHSKKPPVVHSDLKPDNVLLDANLVVKLADFGLSMVSTSVLNTSNKGEEGGTLFYTAPEAFEQDDYRPVRSYDVYSYGILLWTLLTGNWEPYPAGVNRNVLIFSITFKGDRPDLHKIDQSKADGLKELVDLMERCWDTDPAKRPTFKECTEVTGRVFSKHQKGIRAAVDETLTKLDSVNRQEECVQPPGEVGGRMDSDAVPKVEKNEAPPEFDDDYLREAEKNLTKEERESRRLESLALKEKGNGRFKAADYREAERSYTEALGVCPVCFSSDRADLFSNRAAARLHLDLKDQAIADCSRAVELNPDYVRAILRRARLHEKTDKLDKALRDYKTILEKEPGQKTAREACKRLSRQIHDRDLKMESPVNDSLPSVPPVNDSLPSVPPGSTNRKDYLKHFSHLTLNTNTAYKTLSLSENNMMVTQRTENQHHPDHPDRFDVMPQVLCTEGLTGPCYWEVERNGGVYIAVTYGGISRKGYGDDCLLGENDKSWSLLCRDNSYTVTHNSKWTDLPVRSSGSKRVAVYLDCPLGTLSFYKVCSDSLTHLYTFTFHNTFSEPLYAGFRLNYSSSSSSVRLCEQR